MNSKMKIHELTEAQKHRLVEKNPEVFCLYMPDWFADNYPENMFSLRKYWMANHRPAWMADHHTEFMINNRGAWMAVNRPEVYGKSGEHWLYVPAELLMWLEEEDK